MYYIQQIKKDDCGFACLKMLLSNLYKDKNYLFLPQDEEHGQYSFQELVDIAAKNNVTLKGFKTDDVENLGSFEMLPAIFSVNINKNKHALLIYKIKNNKVYYIDPNYGKDSMQIERFIEIWDKQGLVVDSYKENKQRFNFSVKFPYKQRILLEILTGTVCASALASIIFYLLSKTLLSFMLILFGLLVECVSKIVSISLMKKIDYSLLDQSKNKSNNYYLDYCSFVKFKKNYINFPINTLIKVFITFGLIIVSILSNVFNFVIVVVTLILTLINLAFFDLPSKRKLRDIEQDEMGLTKCLNSKDFKNKIDTINSKSYTYSIEKIVQTLLFFACFIGVALFMSKITNDSSFYSICFYCLLSVTLFTTMNSLVNFPQELNNYYLSKQKVINIIYKNNC